MKQVFKLVLFLTIGVVLASCGGNRPRNQKRLLLDQSQAEVEKDDIEEVSVEETDRGELKISTHRKVRLKNDFSNLDEFKLNLNTYTVLFEAVSGNFRGTRIECERTHDQLNIKHEGAFDRSGHIGKVDITLNPNDRNETSFGCRVLDRTETVVSSSVTLLKSVVISGPANYTYRIGAGKLHTLLIEENGVLETGKIDVDLNVHEFISDNGKIVTFPTDKVETGADLDGDSGGVISINTQKAIGKVSVELRGKNAGIQTNEAPLVTEIPPADPKHNSVCRVNEKKHNSRKCNGKRGTTGLQGHRGHDGKVGGSTGRLIFSVVKDTDLQIQVDYFPGLGTPGTSGGEGGLGGPGGKGVTVRWSTENRDSINYFKKTYKGGPEGHQGPRGEDGKHGAHGFIDESLIKLNKFESGSISAAWKNF